MTVDGIRSPIRLRAGVFRGEKGVYYAWPVDDYYDLHFVADGEQLDGSDAILEFYESLADARAAAREIHNCEPTVFMARLSRR